jgi:GT2 family glycosyltransferase
VTAPSPRVSVVVATHQRQELLGLLLDALEAQDGVTLRDMEVVVVDDGSRDGTWEYLQERRTSAPFPLRAIRRSTAGGPATARNEGWRSAGGDLILFTDDDCRPAPDWVRTVLDVFDSDPGVDLVQGRTEPRREEWEGSGPFARTLLVVDEDGYYATCNMGYRRSVLEELDGFDQQFRQPYGEDTDLAWRAIKAGARTRFEPGALVHHAVIPSSWPAHVRDRRRRQWIVLTTQRHPELRSRFHHRYWYEASHPRALLAAAGLVGAAVGVMGGRPLAGVGAVLVAPYVRYRLVERRLPSRPVNQPAAIALALVADLFEVGVMARASARYRTLVL